MRLISWNIARQEEPWHLLATDERIDVALLQEATAPPAGLGLDVVVGDEWRLAGWQDRKFSTAVVRCSSRVEVAAEPTLEALDAASESDLAVSRPGSLAVATVTGETLSAPVIVVSIMPPPEGMNQNKIINTPINEKAPALTSSIVITNKLKRNTSCWIIN